MKRNLQLLMVVAALFVGGAVSDWAAIAGKYQPEQSTEKLYQLGKQLFVTRCASCHNENGDKPLKDGPPLKERALSREVIEKNVNSRLSTATEEEKRGVALYIERMKKTN